MDLAGNYEEPFAPSTKQGSPCVCTCCGTTSSADYEISKYPHRYIPTGWSVNATNRALRCRNCRHQDKTEPVFANPHEVWVDHIDPHGAYEVRDKARITTKRTSPTDRHLIHNHQVHVQQLPQETLMPETETDTDSKKTRGARLKKQGKDVAGAFGAGLQLAAANEAGEVLVDIAKELTDDLPMMQIALAHPDGREVAKVIMALMLHTATEQTDIVPQGEFIGEACKLQMTASSFTLIAPRMNKVRKHLQKLAKIGERASSSAVRARVETHTDEEMEEAYAELEAELAGLKERMDDRKKAKTAGAGA